MEKTIRIYVANLHMYNSGNMLGNWFELPVSKQQIFRALKIGQEGFGEEWIILDYEAPFKIHEYESIDKLNHYAEKLEELPDFLITNLEEAMEYEDLEQILENRGENFMIYGDVSTEEELGHEFVENVYGSISNLSQDQLERYFNYKAFGRDIAIESSGFYGSGGYIEYMG
ncbi:antirestriction protein ArdA [Enterococcus faecalis]|uniref:antirestriction protein ArdA n=1 Tax=Enterococcus faecalis TaxID=1351 RepID=UPI00178026AE|nr:antirestriction protein ArdA [Enterococcus faecalis]MBD9844906.1 antirestriction protein ArdA [Enterococcus faecalis]